MSESISILFGLVSATTFGSGDFAGGFITKKHNVFFVLFISQIVGVLMLLGIVFFIGEEINPQQMIFGSLSGIFGGIGLLAFYRGLAIGNMAIVAPVTAVIAPLIPLIVSLISNLEYTIFHIVGFLLALISIWLVSYSKIDKKIKFDDLKLPILAGVCFGSFLVLIDFASNEKTYFYPLIFARIASITLVFCIIVITRRFERIGKNSFMIIALAGTLDTLGNLFFILSANFGRLDIASILTSMGPAVTILFAWIVLKEKLSDFQFIGLILAILSIILFSI